MNSGREVYQALRTLIDELRTLVAGAAGASQAATNRAQAVDTAGTGAAAPQLFDLPAPFVSRTGKIRITASMTVTGTGGTGAAADQIQFQLRANGALLASSPIAHMELGTTALDAQATLTFELDGQPIGGAGQTYGIEASDVTNAAHTLVIPAAGAYVRAEDVP